MDDFLKKMLKIHWLRPETALWRTFDCMLMHKYGAIRNNAIDLGCGDGIMSFIMAGGDIDKYDVFLDTEDLHGYNKGLDIYNNQSRKKLNLDFNGLRYKYAYGLDHKSGLINKATRLHPFYKENILFDLNKCLPFDGEKFDSAFSNILYWLDDVENILMDWNKVIKKNGNLFLFVPNFNFRDKAWLYYAAPHNGNLSYYNYFDRGYAPLIRHCYNDTEWRHIFNRAGFGVSSHHLYLTDPVMQIWNVGTRPIAPLLINMATKIPADEREQIKNEWVNYFYNFLAPIILGEFDKTVTEENAAFHFYALEKTS